MAKWLGMEQKYLRIDDVAVYAKSYQLSNEVWMAVIKWDFFAKDTVGKQLVRCIDSISANIAEGFGRYSKKDKIRFYRFAFGSVLESIDWVKKAETRQLIFSCDAQRIIMDLESFPIQINTLIKITNEKLAI